MTIIKYLSGYLNPASLVKFPQWNLTNWNINLLINSPTDLEYGQGSVIFNFQESSNNFDLYFSSFTASFVFSRPGSTFQDLKQLSPQFFSTLVDNGDANLRFFPQIIIDHVMVDQFSYENGNGLFILQGFDMQIMNS